MNPEIEKTMIMEQYEDGKITKIERDRKIQRIDDELNEIEEEE